jgi:hypothetical protein
MKDAYNLFRFGTLCLASQRTAAPFANRIGAAPALPQVHGWA